MKIIKNDRNQLVLRSDSYGLILMGFIPVLIAFALTYFLGRSIEIDCQRVSAQLINCDLNEKLLGVTPIGQRTVQGIQGAEVEEYHSSKGGYTYKLVFATENGHVPLTGYSSSGRSDKQDISRRINEFIQSNRQDSFAFDVGVSWIFLIIAFVFGVSGLGLILSAQTVQIEMLRSEGVLRIQKDGLLGSKQQEYSLGEIQDVYLQSHKSHGRHGSSKTYRIALLTTSGEEIPLSGLYTSGAGSKRHAVDAMKKFLDANSHSQEPFS